MKTLKILKMMKNGTPVLHLLIQTQKKRKENKLFWPQSSLKSKEVTGLGVTVRVRKPLVILKAVLCFHGF